MTSAINQTSEYMSAFDGLLTAIRFWHELDDFFEALKSRNQNQWYAYAVGESPPQQPMAQAEFNRMLDEIYQLLRRDHEQDYCGIVYVDNRENPSFVKIYDPNNLGSSCSTGTERALPGWTLSLAQPVDLKAAFPQPGNRRRWWQRLTGA